MGQLINDLMDPFWGGAALLPDAVGGAGDGVPERPMRIEIRVPANLVELRCSQFGGVATPDHIMRQPVGHDVIQLCVKVARF